ncbi:mpv17-like protein [Varroa jacobsoni]|uniref:mpv17-like protein n=1 Tax=Varroa jacobsoni TaxID=62625 RepID=UPI000BF2F18F|nr:mpv17-like protein [Varroa jacobsoni]XP_022693963.1 mpv17-like protein [Varroa jacobsoni]XP_022693964.1 mpv17-like protein [Varroa jacobsoni]XP_022693965.1 mpv17-like protein [Varroa jacobsoni]
MVLRYQIVRLFFARHPLAANVAAYGALSVGAEFTQQTIIRRWDGDMKGEPYDWILLGRYAVYSMILAGPGLFYWFRWLDSRFVGTTFPVVIRKAATDQLISSTSCTVVFYISMSVMEKKEDIFAELRQKFWPTYKVSCCFWPPIQCLNFFLVPPHFRVVTVAVASFVWCNFLCILKRAVHF